MAKDKHEIPKLPEKVMPQDPIELPVCAQGKHVAPNACFQSALFGMVAKGRRKYLNGQRIV